MHILIYAKVLPERIIMKFCSGQVIPTKKWKNKKEIRTSETEYYILNPLPLPLPFPFNEYKYMYRITPLCITEKKISTDIADDSA